MSRIRLAAAGLMLTLLTLPAAAAAGVQLRGVDASAYPTIHASVVLPIGATGLPIVTENGQGVAGLQLQNLGRAKAIPLLIDRSQSMRGKPLADAIDVEAADDRPAGGAGRKARSGYAGFGKQQITQG